MIVLQNVYRVYASKFWQHFRGVAEAKVRGSIHIYPVYRTYTNGEMVRMWRCEGGGVYRTCLSPNRAYKLWLYRVQLKKINCPYIRNKREATNQT